MNDFLQKTYDTLMAAAVPAQTDLRAEAWQQFLAQGLPTRKQEAWRHTDLSALLKQNFTLTSVKNSSAHAKIQEYLLPNAHPMVFIDGYLQKELSQLSALPKGVEVLAMSEAYQRHPKDVAQYFQENSQNAFQSLNAALWQDGVFIKVAENVKVKQPLQCLFINTEQAEPAMQQLRHLVVLQAGAELTLLEHYVATTEQAYFQNISLHMHVARDATLHYSKCQQAGLQGFHMAHSILRQEKNSHCQVHQFALGAQLARENFTVDFQGEQADCQLAGLYLPQGKQQLEFYTEIQHNVANCRSAQFYKGIMNDQANAVFNGKVLVAKNAQKTVAKQKNQNLLLSKTAGVHTHPQLEIYADDVQCNHGATVGELDEAMLFYFRSRGIDENTAKYLLIEGFAKEVVEQITPVDIRHWMQQQIEQKFNFT